MYITYATLSVFDLVNQLLRVTFIDHSSFLPPCPDLEGMVIAIIT